ncbi:unnamed protein product [Phaeothamnion confervicola]
MGAIAKATRSFWRPRLALIWTPSFEATSGGRGGVCVPAAFETAHARWECVVRLCRPAAGFRSITLAELYLGRQPHPGEGLAGASSNRILASTKVVADSATPLDFKVYEDLRVLCRSPPGHGAERAALANDVWQPRDERQPGFHLVMLYETQPCDRWWLCQRGDSEEAPSGGLPAQIMGPGGLIPARR